MLTMVRLLRHRQTKGAETDILDLRDAEPVLYSTLFVYIKELVCLKIQQILFCMRLEGW